MSGNRSKKDQWNERYAGSELIWSAGPNALFASLLDGLAPGRALDVATGEGRNAIWLAEQGWQVDAIDFSDVGIEKAAQIAEKRGVSVNWQVGDVCEHEFAAGAYDLVAILFLHTSPDERAQWLARLASAVSTGGTFIYIGHDPENIESGSGGPQDISLLPSASDVAGFLGDFEIQRAEIFTRSVDSDPGHGADPAKSALDTLVVARKLP